MSQLEFDCRLRYPTDFTLDAAFCAERTVTTLCGLSGSVKTNILSMIAGLRRQDAGRMTADGRTMFDSQAKVNHPPEARRLGYVFQDSLLFGHLTVEANLRYGLQRRGG